MQNSFPVIDPAAKAHSEQFKHYLVNLIAKEGAVNFARFMDLALYAPGWGYYVGGAHKLGAGGDFVTAPELSPLYSYCLAEQCAEIIQHLGQADILELGAGSGRMAIDILTRLEVLDALPTHYFILELSPDLQDRQKQLFQQQAPRFLTRLQWLSSLPSIRGIILANEVLDAMPVRRFKQQNDLLEYYVTAQGAELQWELKPAGMDLKHALEQAEIHVASAYESEINLQLAPFIQGLAESLKQGLMLFVDYGFPCHEYYHPERSRGTLKCHYQHQAHDDPLILLGIQDITAHVDFTAVAKAAIASHLELAGFVNQATFLLNCGLSDLIHNQDPNQLLAVKQLILPSEMGELFKVIGFCKNLEMPLIGFQQHDQRHRL